MLEDAPSSAKWMRYTAMCLLAHALILLGQAVFMIASHEPHTPQYHNHHIHDACHSLGYILATCLIFYAMIVLMIVFTRGVIKEQWALRMLGLPNFALIIFVILNLAWMAYQYNDHDEHFFVINLQIACSGCLLFIVFFLLSFATNGLAQLRPYAKVWVLLLGIPIGALPLIFFYEDLHLHEYLAIATLVPYVLTMLASQRSRLTKALKTL